jgi:3-methyladenine DNA glycosylase Mpg
MHQSRFLMLDVIVQEEATTCLLRSIYLLDELTSDITQRPISQHLEAATSGRSKVVPLALILVRPPVPPP